VPGNRLVKPGRRVRIVGGVNDHARSSLAMQSIPPSRATPDLVCLSHLRWNFVFQRPQHLMSRFARERRVFFFEEPVAAEGSPRLEVTRSREGVWVATPHLPAGLDEAASHVAQRTLLDAMLEDHELTRYALWYYTPMALPFTRHLAPAATAYDCMDELSAFKNAPPALLRREAELLLRADVVFTGGHTLYEAKRSLHPNVHPFPSSVDVAHFARARGALEEPADQRGIPGPRLGFFGVVDERMDLALVEGIARARPDWQLVVLGPVVKIAPESLPRAGNLHWLGQKRYEDLPAYVSGWDVALMPFAMNDATRFISPTKTPEYLAAGRPVVSTPIRDVVRPYGDRGLVRIAGDAGGFVHAIEESLRQDRAGWLPRVDAFLSALSWDATWRGMRGLLEPHGGGRWHGAMAASAEVSP
jgi:glycosyltransferase involved in cell wall biosynthesis